MYKSVVAAYLLLDKYSKSLARPTRRSKVGKILARQQDSIGKTTGGHARTSQIGKTRASVTIHWQDQQDCQDCQDCMAGLARPTRPSTRPACSQQDWQDLLDPGKTSNPARPVRTVELARSAGQAILVRHLLFKCSCCIDTNVGLGVFLHFEPSIS